MFRDNYVPVGSDGTVELPIGVNCSSGYYATSDVRVVQAGMRSVEVYFRTPSAWPSGQVAIVTDRAESNGVYIGLTASGQLTVSVGGSNYTSSKLGLNTDYHVVVTASVNDATVYINGSGKVMDTPTDYFLEAPFFVGGIDGGSYYPGVIYFCRVYNTWLSEDYVASLYANAKGVSLNVASSVPSPLCYAPSIATSNLVESTSIVGSGWSLSGSNYVVDAAIGVSGGLSLEGAWPYMGTLRIQCDLIDYVSGGLQVVGAETMSVLYPDADGHIDFTFKLIWSYSQHIQLISYAGEAADFKVVANSIKVEHTAAHSPVFDDVAWGSYAGFVGSSSYSNGAVHLSFTSASESVTPFLPLVNAGETADYAQPGVMYKMSCTVRVRSGAPRLSVFGTTGDDSEIFFTHTGLSLAADSVQIISGVVVPTGDSPLQWGFSFGVGPSDSAWEVDVYNPTIVPVGLVADYGALSPTADNWPDSFNGFDMYSSDTPAPAVMQLHGINKKWLADYPDQYSAVVTAQTGSKPLYIYSNGNYYPTGRTGSLTITTTAGTPSHSATISLTNPAIEGISRMAIGRDAIVPTHLGAAMTPTTSYTSSDSALMFEGDKTVVMLFKTGATVPSTMYFLCTGDGAGDILVDWSDNTMHVIIHGAIMAEGQNVLAPDTLYELVICKGSLTDSPVYLNGVALTAHEGISDIDAIGLFELGGYALAENEGFSGTMISAAVASVKATSAQVELMWNDGDPLSCNLRDVFADGLVSWWRPGGLSSGDKSWRDVMEADVTLQPTGDVTIID